MTKMLVCSELPVYIWVDEQHEHKSTQNILFTFPACKAILTKKYTVQNLIPVEGDI